jgi:hypothetical protein
MNTAVAGSSDAATVVISGMTAGVLTVDTGIETLNLTSSGAANTIATLTAAGANTLNITGTQDMTITAANTVSEVINAGTAGGAITVTSDNANGTTVTTGSGADAVTMTGGTASTDTVSTGSGNDTVTFSADLANADTVDGGTGTDTLVGISADTVALTRLTAATDNIDGFETLRITDALGANLTMASVQDGITTLRLDAAAANRTVTMEAGAQTVDLRAAPTTALTVNDTGTATSDSLTVTNNAAATDIFAAANLAVGGFETVTFNGSGTGAAASQDFGTITITADTGGTSALVLNGSNGVTTGVITAGTIDASGITSAAGFDQTGAAVGVTSITGSAGADTLVGDASSTISAGAGNDALTGGTGNDTLTGGAGNDTITTDTGNDTVDAGEGNDTVILSDTDASSSDVVDGGNGTDTLVMTENVTADEMVGYTGFEVLRFDQTISGQDLALIPGTNNLTTLRHSDAAAALVVTNAPTSITTLNVLDNGGANSTSDISFARLIDSGTNSLTLTANNAAATDYDAITISNEETITLTSGDTAGTDSLTIDDLTAADATSITVTGSGAVTITNAVISATNLATVDASAMAAAVDIDVTNSAVAVTMTGGTGADTLEGGIRSDTINGGDGADTLLGNQNADTISGGAGADTITGGTGADILTGGAGADDFVFATATTGLTVATAVTITDFVTAVDDIDITLVGSATLDVFTEADGTSVADLTALVVLVDAAFAGTTTTDTDVYVSFNALGTGNAYVFVDLDASESFNTADNFIILTGINTAAEIATSTVDFI